MRTVLVLMRDGGRHTCAEVCGLLTAARELGEPVVVATRRPEPGVLARLGAHGATRVCVADGGLDADPAAAAARLLTELAWQMDTVAVVTGTDRVGREAAARTAVRLASGIVTGAVDLRPGPDGRPVTVQEVCGGAYRVESVLRGPVPVVSLEPRRAVAADETISPVVEFNPVKANERRPRLVSRTRTSGTRPTVAGASVVVAGGRGVGSRDGFALIERVAEALGGAVGGTHAAAASGWCPRDALVGQTGAVVHPRLYVACGISGSVHHRAGMRHADTIVAIDKDPSAPIFRIADVGVIGDLHQILPALLTELDKRRQHVDSGTGTRTEEHPQEA